MKQKILFEKSHLDNFLTCMLKEKIIKIHPKMNMICPFKDILRPTSF
jgi:hypothetical protein